MTASDPTAAERRAARDLAARGFERRIGRMLIGATYIAVALLLVGVALMATQGISPLADAPPFHLGAIAADILALQPTGFLWLGLLVVIATPISRVVVALVGYARSGDHLMVAVSIAILAVITIGVVIAVGEGL